MDGERRPRSESNRRAKRSRGTAFLPIGIVFLAVATTMIFLGTTAWIAFFTMGVTFLIIGMQKPAATRDRPPGETSQG
jgi:ABC-type phosphate transport system permease subunit